MAIPFHARLTVPEETLFRELDGEAVILSLASESYFGLDPVGTRMWQVLTESPSIQVAFETLLGEYEVEEERLRKDLEDLVEKLVDRGLLKVCAEEATEAEATQ